MKKRFSSLMLCAVLLLSLSSCGTAECEVYTAFCRSFDGEASWTVDGTAYAGRITVLTDGGGKKTYTVAYTAPAALAGAVLVATGERVQLSLFGITHPLEDRAKERLGAVLALFEPVALTRQDRHTLTYTNQESRCEVTLTPGGAIERISLTTPAHTVTLQPKEGV